MTERAVDPPLDGSSAELTVGETALLADSVPCWRTGWPTTGGVTSTLTTGRSSGDGTWAPVGAYIGASGCGCSPLDSQHTRNNLSKSAIADSSIVLSIPASLIAALSARIRSRVLSPGLFSVFLVSIVFARYFFTSFSQLLSVALRAN